MAAQWAQPIDQEGLFVPLGDKIKQLRKEQRWSQDELAEKVGAFGHQISRYENNKITPSTEMILKLAETLDVSVDYLLIEGAPRRPLHAADYTFLDRLGDVSQLDEEERASVLLILDALLTKKKVKGLAAGAG